MACQWGNGDKADQPGSLAGVGKREWADAILQGTHCQKLSVLSVADLGVQAHGDRLLEVACGCCSGRLPRALFGEKHTCFLTVCGSTGLIWKVCTCQIEDGVRTHCDAPFPDVYMVRVCDPRHPGFLLKEGNPPPPAGELGLLSDVFLLAVETANLLARVATQRYTLVSTPLYERRCVSVHDCLNPIQIDCMHADHEVVNFWPHIGCSLAGEAGTGWPQHVSVRSDYACKNSQVDLFGATTYMHLAPCPPSSLPPPTNTSTGTPVAGPTPAGLSPPQALGAMHAFPFRG